MFFSKKYLMILLIILMIVINGCSPSSTRILKASQDLADSKIVEIIKTPFQKINSEPRSEVDKQFHLEREVIVRSDDSKTKKLVSVRVYRNDETTPLIDVSKEFMAEKVN